MNLNYNKIQQIQSNTFASFINLETLNLYGNQISRLEYGWFTGLRNLKYLDLNNNNLNSLETGIFVLLSNLLYLKLANNGLSFTSESNFPFAGLTKLQHLELNENKWGIESIATDRPLNMTLEKWAEHCRKYNYKAILLKKRDGLTDLIIVGEKEVNEIEK